MSAIVVFAAMCLMALPSSVPVDAANARIPATAPLQVALNPQPLPPFDGGDDHWAFDEG